MSHLRRLVVVPILPLGFFIACSQMPSDEVVAMRIKASYFSDPLIESALISVSVDRGRVTLSGTVPTAEVELKAFKLALHTDGVRNLNDNLTVDPPVWRAETVATLSKPKHPAPVPSINEALQPRISPRPASTTLPLNLSPSPSPFSSPSRRSVSPSSIKPSSRPPHLHRKSPS